MAFERRARKYGVTYAISAYSRPYLAFVNAFAYVLTLRYVKIVRALNTCQG